MSQGGYVRDTRGIDSANPPAVSATQRQYNVEIVVKRLSLSPATVDSLSLLLPDNERSRARRFASHGDVRRFVVGRATLRELLGERLGISPSSVVLVRGVHGKPVLARERHHS